MKKIQFHTTPLYKHNTHEHKMALSKSTINHNSHTYEIEVEDQQGQHIHAQTRLRNLYPSKDNKELYSY
jgi:hypothetical protein